jgi:hypothetical protein
VSTTQIYTHVLNRAERGPEPCRQDVRFMRKPGTICPSVLMDCDAPLQPNAWRAGGPDMPIADSLGHSSITPPPE